MSAYQSRLYVVEHNYVGPNQRERPDADTIEITTACPHTNMSHEPRPSGWCGTTNDWSVTAHGEFASEDAAREYVRRHWEVREEDDELDPVWDAEVVARYRIGALRPLSAEATREWVHDGVDQEVANGRTDVEAIADGLAEAAKTDGLELDRGAVEGLIRDLIGDD